MADTAMNPGTELAGTELAGTGLASTDLASELRADVRRVSTCWASRWSASTAPSSLTLWSRSGS
ncbi:phosphoenolpyruvate carboxylase [Arthrobacter sp. Hiyo6]|nr:phosphoenolpyruvate carboxylase [Arthrobacter sp. Hiyo6]